MTLDELKKKQMPFQVAFVAYQDKVPPGQYIRMNDHELLQVIALVSDHEMKKYATTILRQRIKSREKW